MNAWEIKREALIPIWQERVRSCRSSGLTVKAWCAENGITKQTYYAWEKLCLQRASCNGTSSNSIIKVTPEALSSDGKSETSQVSVAPAELVIRCGCVSIDISSEMSVSRIADLVSALNQHV